MQHTTTLVLSLAATVTLTACQTGTPSASTWQSNGLAYFEKADQDWNYQFIYHPDAQVYFEPYSETWYWFNDGQWHEGDALPYALPLDRRDAVVVKIDSELPFMSHEQVVSAHPCNVDLPTSIDPFAWTMQQNDLAEAYVKAQEAAREAERRWHDEHDNDVVATADDDANWINEWSEANAGNGESAGRNWNLNDVAGNWNDNTNTDGNWDANTSVDASWSNGTEWSSETNADWNTEADASEAYTPAAGRNWNLHQLSSNTDASQASDSNWNTGNENAAAASSTTDGNWNSEATASQASTPATGRNWNLHQLSSNANAETNAASDANVNTAPNSNATGSNWNSNATSNAAGTSRTAPGRNWNLNEVPSGTNTASSMNRPAPVRSNTPVITPRPAVVVTTPAPAPAGNGAFQPFSPTTDATASKSTVVPLPADLSNKNDFVPFEKTAGADTDEDDVATGDPSAPFENK